MGYKPFFIAILLLIILVNINIKEGFSNNITSDLIKYNETKLIQSLLSFTDYFLDDVNNNIKSTINRDYNNINDNSNNNIDFDTYTTNFRTYDPSFAFINDLSMNITYNNLFTSISYTSLQEALFICQNIIDVVGKNINEQTSLPDDITEYKILLICITVLNDINNQYTKFKYIFNTSNSFTNISGLNLLESQELIIQIIKTIKLKIIILKQICIKYFIEKKINVDLSSIKINSVPNSQQIIDLLKTNDLEYNEYINKSKNIYNNLIQPNIMIN
jgi:hypothetical protein